MERTTNGRRRINIEYVEDKTRRRTIFSKRKNGLMKKAYELSTLTGTQLFLVIASETGHVFTFATSKLKPLVQLPEGKSLIQELLAAPDKPGDNNDNDVEPPSFDGEDEEGEDS